MSGSGSSKNSLMVLNTAPGNNTPMGYQQLGSITTTNDTTLTVPTGAKWAMMVCETQAIRWRDDGTDPTATVGMPLAVGVHMQYVGDLAAFKVIGQVVPAKLNVTYYK